MPAPNRFGAGFLQPPGLPAAVLLLVRSAVLGVNGRCPSSRHDLADLIEASTSTSFLSKRTMCRFNKIERPGASKRMHGALKHNRAV